KMLEGETERELLLRCDVAEEYLAAAPPDLRDTAIVMLDTGLRGKECLALEWPEVEPEPMGEARFGYLTVRSRKRKNSKPRNVPLSDRVLDVLRQRRNGLNVGLVFQREGGRALYQTWLHQQPSTFRNMLGLPKEFVLTRSGTLSVPVWGNRAPMRIRS